MKRCRTGFVLQSRIGAGIQQAAHCGGATGSNGPMQRSGSVLVLGIYLRIRIEQNLDGFYLPFGIRGWAINVAICRVVQGSAAAMIGVCVWVSSGDKKLPNNFGAMAGRRQMQCRIADV